MNRFSKNFSRFHHLITKNVNNNLNGPKFCLSSAFSSASSSNDQKNLLVEKRDGVLWITLNRPKNLNSITNEVIEEMIDAFDMSKNDPDVKLSVVTGKGAYYSSGSDLKQFEKLLEKFGDLDKAIEFSTNLGQKYIDAFIDYPKPLIAVVNGPAFGVMFTTLCLFDYVVANEKAVFTCPFSSLGLTPEGCSTYLFPRVFGPSLASKLLYFSYKMPVEEAHQRGLVSRIIPSDKLQEHLEQWLYAENGIIKTCYLGSMMKAKELVRNKEMRQKLHEINKSEFEELKTRFKSEDYFEALSKFIAKKNKNT